MHKLFPGTRVLAECGCWKCAQPHPRGVHPAAEKGGEFVVFIADLAVRIKSVGVIGDRKRVVVKVTVPWLEIVRKPPPPRMPRAAYSKHFLPPDPPNGRIWLV